MELAQRQRPRTSTPAFHNRPSVKHAKSAVFPGKFLDLNPYRILWISSLDDFGCVPPGLASLPNTSLKTTRPNVVRDDGGRAKLLCHSGFRETSRNFTYLCWDLPDDGEVERTALWVQVSTGLELTAEGRVQVLEADTWRDRHQRLGELGGPPIR